MQLFSVQDRISRLLSLTLSGAYLSNIGRLFYPFMGSTISKKNRETLKLLKYLGDACDLKQTDSLYAVMTHSLRWLRSEIKREPPDLKCVQTKISRVYRSNDYRHPKLGPVNKLCAYVDKELEPFLVDAYIHGSLSTMDFTEYSDLDTLFIVKQDVLEKPELIQELEKRFVRSLRYLYEFDPLQHHTHFFLTELDLKFYNQSFLPISAIELSTSILGKGTCLTFFIRDSGLECQQRFLESVKIIRRCANNTKTLNNPYSFKGMLSHFMILPALFLQLEGNYVSKKASFEILKKRVPSHLWASMDKVSSIRHGWSQNTPFYLKGLIRVMETCNPLLLSYFGKHGFKPNILKKNKITPKLLNEIDIFAKYLLNASGIGENRFEN